MHIQIHSTTHVDLGGSLPMYLMSVTVTTNIIGQASVGVRHNTTVDTSFLAFLVVSQVLLLTHDNHLSTLTSCHVPFNLRSFTSLNMVVK